MALHRDIFWVGRQWAVTGYGVQAVDQKLKGQFDIEAIRLWEDGLVESMPDDAWFNRADFDKALSVARARHPMPPGAVAPAEAAAPPEPPVPPEPAPPPEQPVSPPPLEANASRVMESALVEPQQPAAPVFAMRIEGWSARFVRPWRVRIRG